MSYWYQYKRQCFIPSGAKHATPAFTPCHAPGVVRSVPCTLCSKDAKLCTARRVMPSCPKRPVPCTSSCVEKHVVEGHSSSCSHKPAAPCTMALPQSHLCVPHCRQLGVIERPQVCPLVHTGQHSLCPCSYQWSDSYHYHCGQS